MRESFRMFRSGNEREREREREREKEKESSLFVDRGSSR